jgi:MFS family permease
LRFFHGFSTGFKPTGTTAYLADIVPIHKRGEALGMLGVSGSTGMALGPVIGSAIAAKYGTTTMFYCSSFMAFLSFLTIANMKETVAQPQAFAWRHFKVSREDIFDFRVLTPAAVLVFYTFSFGTILTLAPDFSDHLGINNRGLIFTIILSASITMRVLAGKASDKYGRYKVLLFGTVFLFLGMSIIGSTEKSELFFIGGALFGMANGIISPTVFALAVDLAAPEKKGRAMATIFIALEIGVGIGALVSAWLYNNNPDHFFRAFATGSLIALGSIAVIVYQLKKGKS